MLFKPSTCAAVTVALCAWMAARGASLQGKVANSQDAPIASARVMLRTARGTEQSTTTDSHGRYSLRDIAPGDFMIVVLAAGFRSQQVAITFNASDQSRTADVHLMEGGISDEIVVTTSCLDLPLSQTPAATSILDRSTLEKLHIQSLADALRYIPGVQVDQTGRRGASTSVFIRGGESDFNLVLVDGVQVNEFGGNYDFATLPADAIERIEVVRGPQSALYGSDAISSAVNIITKKGTASPTLDFLAEGGSFSWRRFAVGGQGILRNWRVAANASRSDTNGIRLNDDYHSQNLSLNLERDVGSRHSMSFQVLGNSNEVGSPGPFGSDPLKAFSGIDTISRSHNQSWIFRLGYRANLSPRLRQRLDGNWYTGKFIFDSPFGASNSEHFRGSFRSQTDWTVASKDILSIGFEYEREAFLNTYVTDDTFRPFHMRRGNYGYFMENLWTPTPRWLVSTGWRLENIRSAPIPGSVASGRPPFQHRSVFAADPKLAVSYAFRLERPGEFWGKTTLRTSAGRGLRAASGFELAFTDNPRINPERSAGLDVGVEQSFLRGKGTAQLNFFYSRFSHLIITLGGASQALSEYRSDNLANAGSRGAEWSLTMNLATGLSISGQYTYLISRVLALDGSSRLAPLPFQVGQPLLRRPAHSGSLMMHWRRGRWSGTLDGFVRSKVLDVEPNFGASGGLFHNPGYLAANAGLAYALSERVSLYARVNNLANRKYEESFGFPSLPLNFVAGVRWQLPLQQR